MKLFFKDDGKINENIVFPKGTFIDMDNSTGSASMWIKRGVADECIEEVVVEKAQEISEIVAEVVAEIVQEVAIPEVKVENKKGNRIKKGL